MKLLRQDSNRSEVFMIFVNLITCMTFALPVGYLVEELAAVKVWTANVLVSEMVESGTR